MTPSRPRYTDEGLITGEAVALSVRHATIVARCAGAVIDAIVTFAILISLTLLALRMDLDSAALQAVGVSVAVFCLVIMPLTIELVTRGRSLGKLAMGIRVVRDDGGAIGLRHAFIRALVGVVEVYITFGGIALIVGFMSPSTKRLGDMLAGTHAQVERVPKLQINTFGIPPELAGWAKTADVGRLPDRLERRIAAYFQTARHLLPEHRIRSAIELAAEAAPFVSTIPNVPAEQFLAAIVVIRRERDLATLNGIDNRMAQLAPILKADA